MHWVIVGVMALNVAFVMAEIAAAYPTAGGIYFWSYRLGGQKWGPFLAWMTAVSHSICSNIMTKNNSWYESGGTSWDGCARFPVCNRIRQISYYRLLKSNIQTWNCFTKGGFRGF